MKKIVITGATSMIGIAVICECLEHSIESIYAIVRPKSKTTYRLPKDTRIHIIECDIHDYENLHIRIPEKCDTFFHFAWSETGTERNRDIIGQAKNVIYSLNAIKTAEKMGCKKFVGSGSQAEYGRLNAEKTGLNSPIDPIQPYGIAKYAAGKLIMEEAKNAGMSCIWVRIFSIYGEYDRESSLICSTINKMIYGGEMSFTAGMQKWDYLYSYDAGKAFYLIGEKVCGCKIYCLGSGTARPLHEYIETIRDIIRPNLQLTFGEIPYTEQSIMDLCADITEIKSDTGWHPETQFADGIRKMLSVYKFNK